MKSELEASAMLPVSRPSLPPLDRFVELLEDIWKSRMLSNFGKYARRFERTAQEYLGNPRTRAVVNCDIGLLLSVAALALPEGSECLVQSFTFNSTINAILWNRLTPVFVDIDPRTLNVDCDDLERRITPATRAIVVTHIFGSPLADRPASSRSPAGAACGSSSTPPTPTARPIADSASAIRGLGDFQVFSFSGTKPLTSAEGGLVSIATRRGPRRLRVPARLRFPERLHLEVRGPECESSPRSTPRWAA